jgi:hypothetical protein
MATQITSTKGSYDFKNGNNVAIPIDGQFDIGIPPAVKFVESDRYHIDRTQKFPQTPPTWVMESQFLADLVSDGLVTVQ